MSESRAVLVTGATGFLGSHLVRRLDASGYRVHALARESSDRLQLAHVGPVWHTADLGVPTTVRNAFASFTAAEPDARRYVVHGGALISYRTADAERARMINVEGTRAVLEAAKGNGVERLVHVSSVVTVGQARDAQHILSEEAGYNGARLRSSYVTTKRAAEDYVHATARELDVVVVNPGAIFGEASRPSNTARFLIHLARGSLRGLAPPGSLGVVGVADVAEGIRLALEHGRSGRRYLLVESNMTLLELMTLASERMGISRPRRRVPARVWSLAVVALGLLDRFRALDEVTPESLRLLGEHYRFDSTRARGELGWSPRPFQEVLDETIAWLERTGRLDSRSGWCGSMPARAVSVSGVTSERRVRGLYASPTRRGRGRAHWFESTLEANRGGSAPVPAEETPLRPTLL